MVERLLVGAAAAPEVVPAVGAWLTQVWPWLGTEVVGNELWRLGLALVTLVAVVLLRRLAMHLVVRGLRQITTRTRTEIDDQIVSALDPPLGYFIGAAAFFLAGAWLNLPAAAVAGLTSFFRVATVICVGWAGLRSTELITSLFARFARRTASELDDRLVPLVGRMARALILVMVAVLIVQELGFDVTGILTGLGVGGLAFALAAKDTLANWFGALMIYTDRPFDVGDWIKTASLEGVVEEIGLRSTRVRTFAKTVVAVPNSSLANDVVENFSRMPMRRVYFELGVTYGTSPAMVRESVARIEDLLRGHPEVDQTFWLVKFHEFAASSLNIIVYYFTATTEWARYLQIRGDVNLAILERLGEIGVQVAFPSTSVYVERPDPEALRRLDARARELFAARAPATRPADTHIGAAEDG